MILRMLRTAAGPEYTVQAGELWECPDAQLAHTLIDDGSAEEYTDAEAVEMVSTFHGGLKAASRPLQERTGEIPAPADGSQTKEDNQVVFPIDRRTADELAVDARRAALGPVASAAPEPAKTSNQQAADEIAVKIAVAKAAKVDPKGSAHARLVTDSKVKADKSALSTAPVKPQANDEKKS